jgi:hypothetical protein
MNGNAKNLRVKTDGSIQITNIQGELYTHTSILLAGLKRGWLLSGVTETSSAEPKRSLFGKVPDISPSKNHRLSHDHRGAPLIIFGKVMVQS